LLEFSKASKEVAIDVPNKFITFDFFLQFLFQNLKSDVHNYQGSSSNNLPTLKHTSLEFRELMTMKGEKKKTTFQLFILALKRGAINMVYKV